VDGSEVKEGEREIGIGPPDEGSTIGGEDSGGGAYNC